MLFVTSRSTDLPMQSVSFTTLRVWHFVSHTLKMDSQDILCKMQGYTVQELKGMSIKYE